MGLYPDVQVCVNALRMERSQATTGVPVRVVPPGITSKAATLDPVIVVNITMSVVSEKICVFCVAFCLFTS